MALNKIIIIKCNEYIFSIYFFNKYKRHRVTCLWYFVYGQSANHHNFYSFSFLQLCCILLVFTLTVLLLILWHTFDPQKFRSVKKEDAGEYYCQARNEAGWSKCSPQPMEVCKCGPLNMLVNSCTSDWAFNSTIHNSTTHYSSLFHTLTVHSD